MHQARAHRQRVAHTSRAAAQCAMALALVCAITLCAPSAYAADSLGRSGIAGVAKALQDDLAPSLLTFEKAQETTDADGGIDISDARVQGLQDVMYDGQAENPTITLKLKGQTLREGEDFDVEFDGDMTNPGTVEVTITGKGSYTGTITTAFTIVPGDLSYAEISVIPDQAATGKELRPAPTVSLYGYELTEGVDYEVEYSDNVEEGTATLVITGIGNCTGDARATFEVVEEQDSANASARSWSSAAPYIAASAAIGGVALGAVAITLIRRKKQRPTP